MSFKVMVRTCTNHCKGQVIQATISYNLLHDSVALPGVLITFEVDAWANHCKMQSLMSCLKGLSENQARVAGNERQISDKQTAVYCW